MNLLYLQIVCGFKDSNFNLFTASKYFDARWSLPRSLQHDVKTLLSLRLLPATNYQRASFLFVEKYVILIEIWLENQLADIFYTQQPFMIAKIVLLQSAVTSLRNVINKATINAAWKL